MIEVPANDHGAIYVLELLRPAPEGLEQKTDAAIMAVLGKVVVNTDFVDAVMPGALADMTLPDFIRSGYDMPVSDADAEKIRALLGTVVLVMSAAFGGNAMMVDLPSDVRLVTILRDTPLIHAPQPITSKGAEGVLTPNGKKPTSNAAMSGRVATIVLLGLFFLVAIMIWIAG